MSAYDEKALNTARNRSLTAAEVRALDYRQVAQLAGVTVKPDGNSPADFFWRNVRHAVATELEREETATRREGVRSQLESFLRASLGAETAEVVVTPDGWEVRE